MVNINIKIIKNFFTKYIVVNDSYFLRTSIAPSPPPILKKKVSLRILRYYLDRSNIYSIFRISNWDNNNVEIIGIEMYGNNKMGYRMTDQRTAIIGQIVQEYELQVLEKYYQNYEY